MPQLDLNIADVFCFPKQMDSIAVSENMRINCCNLFSYLENPLPGEIDEMIFSLQIISLDKNTEQHNQVKGYIYIPDLISFTSDN